MSYHGLGLPSGDVDAPNIGPNMDAGYDVNPQNAEAVATSKYACSYIGGTWNAATNLCLDASEPVQQQMPPNEQTVPPELASTLPPDPSSTIVTSLPVSTTSTTSTTSAQVSDDGLSAGQSVGAAALLGLLSLVLLL